MYAGLIYPPLTQYSYGTQMITIRAGHGGQQRDFVIYENLARASSEFIGNALKGSWRESTDRTISLTQFQSTEVGIYHHWLLTGQVCTKMVPSADSTPRPRSIVISGCLIDEIGTLTRLSHLSHYLLDTCFTDAISDAIVQCSKEMQSVKLGYPLLYGTRLYDIVPEGSPTRSLVADIVAWTTDTRSVRAMRKTLEAGPLREIHSDFALDVLEATIERFNPTSPATSPLKGSDTGCKYHSHGDEKPCYKTKIAT
jgi:hypothetical protein